MKKIFSIFAASLMLFAASCSSEKLDEPNGDGNVTFSVQLPSGLNSRAIGDGTTATKLYVAAYEAGTKTPLAVANGEQSIADMNNRTATVTLQLVTGKTYDLVFWAQADGAPYTFTPNGRTVDMNYSGATANAEKRDAFFYIWNDFRVTGPMDETVTLKRPFAQLNFATSDWDAAQASGLNVATTSVEVKQLLPTLDLMTGNAKGDAVNVTFTDAALPGEGITIGGNAYKYLALNYLLMDATRTTVDVKLTAKESASDLRELTVSSVPVQRNYRTNIYGALLTSTTNFNVTINPEFATPDIESHLTWDIATINSITSAGGDVTFAQNISTEATENTTPTAKTAINQVGGVIDGNGYELAVSGAWGTWDCAIHTKGGTIKNLTISGAFRGIFTWGLTEDLVVDNVVINPGAYTFNADSSGGRSVTFTNSTLNGWTSYTSGFSSFSFINCKFGSNGYYAYLRPYSPTTLTNCTFSVGYELDARCTDGIVLKNCKVGETLITADNITSLLGSDAASVTIQND
ncbi:MAG: hypothetical protein PUD91_07835 [Bacteroidales bacterium]|nr:hypothetical protein [Bacteroidales bacterium]